MITLLFGNPTMFFFQGYGQLNLPFTIILNTDIDKPAGSKNSQSPDE